MEKNLSTFTYIASGMGAFLSFLNNNAAAIGVIIAFCTLLLNWYYQHKRDRFQHNEREED